MRVERHRLATVLGKRYAPSRVTLADMDEYHPGITAAKAKVKALLADMANVVAAGRSVILYGGVGTGKDRLLAAMLYAAIDAGKSCHWTNGLEIYGKFRDAMDGGKTEQSLLESTTTPDVLGISDPTPPFGSASDWNIATLYRVIDKRYRAARCTWVTLNAMSADDAEKQLSDRVFDRLMDGAVMVPCFWPSFRERNKAS